MTAQTPVYGLQYLVEGEPVNHTRAVIQNNAEKVEAALIRGGIGPADTQLLLARMAQNAHNVLSYGAVGNGSTNDLPAIQAALDAAHTAGGGTVLIPGGRTYATVGFMVVYDNTTITAYGATIRSLSLGQGLVRNFLESEAPTAYTGHSNIKIYGGTWDGNAANAGVGTVTGLTNIMGFVHCKNITIRDATITNGSSSHGVEFNSTDGGQVLNCRFLGMKDNTTDNSRAFVEAVQIDLARAGSSSIGAYDNTVSKNILVDGCYSGPSDRLPAWGRLVGSHVATLTGQPMFTNIRVVNNRIDGAADCGIHAYCWDKAVISGNIITGTASFGIRVSTDSSTTNVVAPGSVIIANNIIEDCLGSSSIQVTGYATALLPGLQIIGNRIIRGTGRGITVDSGSWPVVANNIVMDPGSNAIYLPSCLDPTVTGNVVRNVPTNAINLTSCTGGTVTGNQVVGTTTNHGIYAVTCTAVLIEGNKVVAAAGGGIRLSTSTGCSVIGNKIRKGGGLTTAGISITADSTGCVVVGNDTSGDSYSTGAISIAAGAGTKVDYAGGTTVPGHNLT